MKARKVQKTYNLERWQKVNDTWRHVETVVWNKPYGLCKGMKNRLETNKKHFEFYKITPN